MKKCFPPLLVIILTLSFVVPTFPQRTSLRQRPSETPNKSVISSKTVFDHAFADSDGLQGVHLEWATASETNNVGFYIYRTGVNGRILVNEDIVQGSYFLFADRVAYGQTYELFDPQGGPNDVYEIESVGFSGQKASVVASNRMAKDLSLFKERSERKQTNAFIADNDLSVSKSLQQEIEASELAPDINTHRWVITQPGVRIGVKGEGMFRVTSAELAAAGFDTASNPANWQLYLEGNQQAIKVGPGGSYIEFYGKGIDRLESDTQSYFLIIGPSGGKRIQQRLARPNTSTVVSPRYAQTFKLKERTNYNQNILNGDAENFWGRVVGPSPSTTLNFQLSGLDPTAGNAVVRVWFQGFSAGEHQVNLTLNGTPIGSATGYALTPFGASFTVPVSQLVEGTNALEMISVAPGPPADFSFFDRIEIDFGRRYLASNNRIKFHTELNKKASLSGFSSANVRVFDTTVEAEPMEVLNLNFVSDGQSFGAEIPAARSRRYYAVSDSAMLTASSISPIDPALLTDPSINADLLIVTHKNFLPQANAWSQYRQDQGFSVKIVEVQEIYDEFNYGVMSADSIKAFLQMISTTWATAPAYVLLLGDATSDPRDYRGFGFANFVPTRMIDTIFTETGSDEFLADFNGDGLAEMAIGRVAARTGEVITLVFNKTVYWENNFVNSLDRGALFAHDRPDGWDFEGMNNLLRNQLPTGTPSTMVHRDEPNAQANLIAAMNSGKYIVNYSGHGTAGAWATSSFFANSTIPLLTNNNNESIFTMLTCLNGYFILPNSNSLAENIVHHNNGGAVAAWSSTGLTTPDIQQLMAVRFYQQISASQIQRIGDLIRDAKSVIPGGSDVRLSWALLGDPMLKIRQPGGGDLKGREVNSEKR